MNGNLLFSCCVMLIGAVCTGLMLGLSSPLIPSIQEDQSATRIVPKITDDEASWVGVSIGVYALNI